MLGSKNGSVSFLESRLHEVLRFPEFHRRRFLVLANRCCRGSRGRSSRTITTHPAYRLARYIKRRGGDLPSGSTVDKSRLHSSREALEGPSRQTGHQELRRRRPNIRNEKARRLAYRAHEVVHAVMPSTARCVIRWSTVRMPGFSLLLTHRASTQPPVSI